VVENSISPAASSANTRTLVFIALKVSLARNLGPYHRE